MQWKYLDVQLCVIVFDEWIMIIPRKTEDMEDGVEIEALISEDETNGKYISKLLIIIIHYNINIHY